jgi:hypothetical protein
MRCNLLVILDVLIDLYVTLFMYALFYICGDFVLGGVIWWYA